MKPWQHFQFVSELFVKVMMDLQHLLAGQIPSSTILQFFEQRPMYNHKDLLYYLSPPFLTPTFFSETYTIYSTFTFIDE